MSKDDKKNGQFSLTQTLLYKYCDLNKKEAGSMERDG